VPTCFIQIKYFGLMPGVHPKRTAHVQYSAGSKQAVKLPNYIIITTQIIMLGCTLVLLEIARVPSVHVGWIYGVIAYFVSQRTQEIGVRMALGATPGSVMRLILGQAMRPVAAGAVVGIGAALAASRVLTSQLFGVTRTDPVTIAAVVGVLAAVALVASVIPARRAAAIDPTKALQSE